MNLGGFNALSNWWLALLVVPLVLFYFLKLKRPRFQIPSLALWQQALQDQRVNSPFQKFKRNLLLLLQILLLLLLVLAALQPFWRGSASSVKRLPVLIDCSASMGALDKAGGQTRLAEAKKRVREMIDGLAAGRQMSLISFSRTARKRIGFTNNKRLLRDALDQIEVENSTSDLEEGLRLAQAMARSEPFDEVFLFSDGNLPARANFDLSFQLNYQRLSPAGPNLGITGLSAQRGVNGGWEVFVQVEGSANAEGNAELALSEGGTSVAKERLIYTKGRSQRMEFQVSGEKPTALEVRLTPDGFDSLAVDNVAFLDLPEARPLKVFVPASMISYRRVFGGIAGVQLWPQGTNENVSGGYDLVISDRAKDMTLSAHTRLSVGIVPGDLELLVAVGTNGTSVVDWRRDEPVLQHVELGDLMVLEQPQWNGNGTEARLENLGYEVLVHGRQGPLLVRRREGDALNFTLLFHTDQSTLPYRVGFPIFVENIVQAALGQAGLAEIHGARSLLSPSETSLASVDHLEFNEKLAVGLGVKGKVDWEGWRLLVMLAGGVLMVEWWFFQKKPGGWKA